MHAWNVELARKVEKNLGHDGLVKLLPNDVSNADGSAVATVATEDSEEEPDTVVGGREDERSAEDASGRSDVVAEPRVVVSGRPEDVCDSETVTGTTSCRGWRKGVGLGEGMRRST